MDILIISGLSGGGKSKAASYLEAIQDRDQVEIYWSQDLEQLM